MAVPIQSMLKKRSPGPGRGPLKVKGSMPRGAQNAATRLLQKKTKPFKAK